MESQSFEYGQMSPATITPVPTNTTSSPTINGLNISAAQQNTLDPLSNTQAQILLMDSSPSPVMVLNAAASSLTQPSQISTSSPGIVPLNSGATDVTPAQDLTMLVNQEQLSTMLVVNPVSANSIEPSNSPQVSIASVSSSVSMIPDQQQQSQLTATSIPSSGSPLISTPQEPQTAVNTNAMFSQLMDHHVDNVDKQNEIMTSTPIIDQANPLTVTDPAVLIQIAVEQQQKHQEQIMDHMIIDNDHSTAANVQAHDAAQVALQNVQAQAEVQASVQAAVVAAVEAEAQARVQAQLEAQMHVQVQAAQVAQAVAVAAAAQVAAQAAAQAAAVAVAKTAVAVAHAAAMAQAQAQVHANTGSHLQPQQTQILPGANDPGQPPVVLMLDNSGTNNQTPSSSVDSVPPNDPMQPMLTMEIVNPNSLQASPVNPGMMGQPMNAQMFIGNNPQTDSIHPPSAQPPPMPDLSPIVQSVTTAWNMAPTSGPPNIVSPVHMLNVGEHMIRNAVIADANILNTSSPPLPLPAQTLTFVTEHPQLDMQAASEKSNDGISDFSPPQSISSGAQDLRDHPSEESSSSRRETQIQIDDAVDGSEDRVGRVKVETETMKNLRRDNINDSGANGGDRSCHGHNGDDRKSPQHDSTSSRSQSDSASDSRMSSPREPSLTDIQPCADEVESSKTAESQATASNWSNSLDDLTMDQLYSKLGQYEHPNLTKEQLVAKLKCLGKSPRGPKDKRKRHRNDSRRSSFSDGSDDNDVPLTPADTDDIKQESENVVAGSSQSSPSMGSVKPESAQDEKQDVHRCMWRGCTKVLNTLDTLISHVGDAHIGSGKATYACDWEGCLRGQKPFTKRHKMYNHLRTHTGERPFVCNINGCGKRFSRPDSLTTHVKTHSNIRPYKCPFKNCTKAYYHSRSLRKHEKTHDQRTAHNSHSLPSVHPIGNGMHISFTPTNRMFPTAQPQPQAPLYRQRSPGFDSTSNPLPSRDLRSGPPPQPVHPHHLPPVHQLHPPSPVGPSPPSNSSFGFPQNHRLIPQPPPQHPGQHNNMNYHYHSSHPAALQPPPLNHHRPELVHHPRTPSFDGSQQGTTQQSSSPSNHFFAHPHPPQPPPAAPSSRPTTSSTNN
ncbi:13234_t:CDS:2 [Acaulospora colombiana]|uniref:13234_t:CDS:1 n=1 Tax=Acaulospora colombiana TaxID=27376 RepID=A0ACA9KTC0_9GLOM|nr:13234_t:CDS:2 [Acaulospora colombiana]